MDDSNSTLGCAVSHCLAAKTASTSLIRTWYWAVSNDAASMPLLRFATTGQVFARCMLFKQLVCVRLIGIPKVMIELVNVHACANKLHVCVADLIGLGMRCSIRLQPLR